MQNVLLPSGAKATDLLSGKFHTARSRLTLIYVAILMVILFLSSSILYSAFASQLRVRYAKFPMGREMEVLGVLPPRQQDVLKDLTDSLVIVNGLLLIGAGVLSYWLAGITLRPIQASYDRQRRFLGDASHELRTPLTILQLEFEQELHEWEITDEKKERVKSHLEEVERMTRLVNDVLSLSRLDDRAAFALTLKPLDLSDVLSRVVDRLQGMAAKHEVSLLLSTDLKQIFILAQEDLVVQALTNVIKNAITYNVKNGSIHVTLKIKGERAMVMVQDTGIGMKEEELAHVFERFYRVDSSRSRQTGGSGLGLSIVYAIMKRLGGSVDVKSVVEKGTEVTLFFPVLKSS